MKKFISRLLICTALTGCLASCNNFFDTEYNEGIDVDNGLTSVDNIKYALNGTYYQLFRFYFTGNYSLTIGDMAGDMAYLNGSANHWTTINHYSVTADDSYLSSIWEYGYKVVDNSARIIKAGKELESTTADSDKAALKQYLAEAYGLRGYAMLAMTNIFGKQIKVNETTDNSDAPGIVIIDEPIQAFEEVSRSTVGACYKAILEDFNNALTCYEESGTDGRETNSYLSVAAIEGLMARTYLYLEDFENAAKYAQYALEHSNKKVEAYTEDSYKKLYTGGDSNTESIFRLAIDVNNSWSANSCGNVWTTYGGLPSQRMRNLIADTDCRGSLYLPTIKKGSYTQMQYGGKFWYGGGNTAYATNYIVNAPEMELIIAEAKLRAAQPDLNGAKEALLTVAKRNSKITSADDLGNTKEEVFAFLKDERARELFQEGFRFYDLRRWGEKADVYANVEDQVSYKYTNYDISQFCYPIPSDEINAGFGIEQTPNWNNYLPK